MAPLVWGERATMNQMLWYTVILIGVTVLPVTFGAFGLIYFVSAIVLACCCCAAWCAWGRKRVDRASVVGLQVLAAVSRIAVRSDGGRPKDSVLMDEAPAAKRVPSPKPLSQLLPRIMPHASRLAAAFVCLLVSVGIALAFPQIVRGLLDAAFVRGDSSLLDKIALSLVGLFALQALLNFAQVYLLTITSERVLQPSGATSLRT